MAQDTRNLSPRMVILINKEEDKKKLEDLFTQLKVPIHYQIRGRGTAPSEMLDIFGLSGTVRLMTIALMPRSIIADFVRAADKKLAFRQKGGGIILTLPLVGLQQTVVQVMSEQAKAGKPQANERKGHMMEQAYRQEFVMIWVSVAGGHSDEVVDAARAVGVKGGTVLRGRQRNSEWASEGFGLATQEERDFVMMVVPKDQKAETVAAIAKECGLTSEARGVILALPVDEAFGLTI